MPKVSIIVPVYNASKYLVKCLDTLTRQTLKDIEIILINDGSTDDSAYICDKYSKLDLRIKVLHKMNEGVSKARNVGINIAQGDYIGFVDSDDWIELDMYENLYNSCVNNKADISIIGIKEINEDMKVCNLYIPNDSNIKFSDILKRAYPCNKIFKKELFYNNKLFFKEGRYFEDLELIPKLYLNSKNVTYVEKVGYNYLQRSDSITGIRDEKILDNMWAYTQLKKFLIDNNYYNRYEVEYIKGIYNAKHMYRNVLYEYKLTFLIKKYKTINQYFKDMGYINRKFYIEILTKSIVYNVKLRLHNVKNKLKRINI